METINQAQYSATADRAYERVDALLRAYGFSHSAVRSRHCLRILEEATQKSPGSDDQLESLAAAIALSHIHRGVEKIMLATGVSTDTANRQDFYLALQAASIPQNRPDLILDEQRPEDALIGQIRAHYESQAKPTLRRISMGAPSLRFDAIGEVTETTERFLQRNPLIRSLLKLLIVGMTLYLVYTFAK
jgi:hypothetical protein